MRCKELLVALEEVDVRIMFVDNDLDYLHMVEVATKLDDTFFAIENGAISALGKLAKVKYEVDVVITDLAMSDFDGIFLTEQIRKNELIYRTGKPIHIYWFTGFKYDMNDTNDPIVRAAIQNHVKRIFTKPYDVLEIIREVKKTRINESDEAFIQ